MWGQQINIITQWILDHQLPCTGCEGQSFLENTFLLSLRLLVTHLHSSPKTLRSWGSHELDFDVLHGREPPGQVSKMGGTWVTGIHREHKSIILRGSKFHQLPTRRFGWNHHVGVIFHNIIIKSSPSPTILTWVPTLLLDNVGWLLDNVGWLG